MTTKTKKNVKATVEQMEQTAVPATPSEPASPSRPVGSPREYKATKKEFRLLLNGVEQAVLNLKEWCRTAGVNYASLYYTLKSKVPFNGYLLERNFEFSPSVRRCLVRKPRRLKGESEESYSLRMGQYTEELARLTAESTPDPVPAE